MRLFVGIPVAPATERALHELAARLRAGQDGLRWTPPVSWHITLQFLGETTAEQGSCIIGALQEIKSVPVKIALERVASFGRAGGVTVTVALTGSLRVLQSAVTRASLQCGFVPEERPFSPHITLARVKRGARFRPHGVLQEAMQRPLRLPGYVADEFLLYESFLGRGGAKYEVRARFPLAASADGPQI